MSDMNEMDKALYNSILRNSVNGTKQSAKPSKYVKVNKQKLKKSIIALCCTCVVFGAIAANGVKLLAEKIGDSFELFNATNDFKIEAIVENTHRTNDMQNYWYDYEKIADHVKTDEDVYLLYRNLGEEQSNKVLQYTDNKTTIQDFVASHNYKDINDWSKTANEQILLGNEIAEKQNELNTMQEEYNAQITPVTENNNQLGGGK